MPAYKRKRVEKEADKNIMETVEYVFGFNKFTTTAGFPHHVNSNLNIKFLLSISSPRKTTSQAIYFTERKAGST